MRRLLASFFIVVYLGALSWGILSHAVGFGTTSHPVMYFLVWDMFCGWSSFTTRIEIIGEGESGKYYELAPGPWGEIMPYGDIGRRHYDYLGAQAPSLAGNVLRQTQHEPITRIFVVEECWAKKYNIPDKLWEKVFNYPKDMHKYYQVRHVFTPDGILLKTNPTWLNKQYSRGLRNNPRLMADVRRGKPFFAVNYRNRIRGSNQYGAGNNPAAHAPPGARLGN